MGVFQTSWLVLLVGMVFRRIDGLPIRPTTEMKRPPLVSGVVGGYVHVLSSPNFREMTLEMLSSPMDMP